MIEDRRIVLRLNEYMEKNESVAVVNIVSTNGSTPRGVGSTMLVDREGNLIEGTIGGGILEERARQDAVNCIENIENKLINYDLNNFPGNNKSLPMKCGGKVSIFVKIYNSREKLIIAGAGHVSEKISNLAKNLGYYVAILDDRKNRLNPKIFQGGRRISFW